MSKDQFLQKEYRKADYDRGRARFLAGGLMTRDENRYHPEMKRGWHDAFMEKQAALEAARDPQAVPHLFRKRPPEDGEGSIP
jgi:hypothetical protein